MLTDWLGRISVWLAGWMTGWLMAEWPAGWLTRWLIPPSGQPTSQNIGIDITDISINIDIGISVNDNIEVILLTIVFASILI